MNSFFKSKFNLFFLVTSLIIGSYVFHDTITHNKICNEAMDDETILECVDTQKLKDEKKLAYLSSKYNELNKIDLTKKHTNPYKDYRILSVYASLIEIVPSSIKERNKLIKLLSKNLDDNFVLSIYLDINNNLSKEDKINLVNKR